MDEQDELAILSDDDTSLLDRLYAPDSADMSTKYEKCIRYICSLKDPEALINDSRAHRVVHFMTDYSEDNDDLIKSIISSKHIIDVFANLISYYKNQLKAFLSSYARAKREKLNEDLEHQYLEQFDFISELIYLIRNLTNKSKSLCYKFHDVKGTEAILTYLDDETLVKRALKLKQRTGKSSASIKEIGFNFLMGLLGTLLNISYIADYRKKDFEDLKSTNIVIKFIEHIKTNENARLLAYVTLTNVVNENDIETALDTNQAIEDIVALIRKGADLISEKDNLKRIRVDVDFDEDNEVFEDVCMINEDWNILDLLLALYRLAVNDKLKLLIYEEHNVSVELQKLFSYGNDTEKEYTAKLLWQMCFDRSIAKKVQEAELLYAYIQDLAEREDVTNKNLKRYCRGIIWSISKAEQNIKVAAQILVRSLLKPQASVIENEITQESGVVATTSATSKGKHIMISYNSQSRDDCLKVKAELEKLGYTIWIDVQDINGSSLESMAKAIENSKCVLMCMTEKYKQSPNCRAEAEYAFKLNVPIIPLIMQTDYMPDGWLGIILGSKIFVNFKRYPFEECMRRLMLELRPIFPPPTKVEIKVETPMPTSATNPLVQAIATSEKTNDSVKSWSNQDVQDWCSKMKVEKNIKSILKNFNGELLIQLNEIRKQSPDYFYKSISNEYNIDLYSVVYFINEFQKLFK